MATQGPLTWFDQAVLKVGTGILLGSDSFKAILLGSGQAISNTFAGTSTDCRYSDLTAELATANGYTTGGLALTSVTLTRTLAVVKWNASPISWTLTGAGITWKYFVIYDDTIASKPLICYCDMDTTGGSLTAIAGLLQYTPDPAGLLGWHT